MHDTTRPDRPEWLDSVKIGDKGQDLVRTILARMGLDVTTILGRNDFDLSVIGAVEVKFDRLAAQTGHVAIELSYRGKPSGITSSVANCWAIVAAGKAYFCPSEKLRSEIAKGNFRRVRAGENAVVALMPLSDLARISMAAPLLEAA